jgi:hypothetical protein
MAKRNGLLFILILCSNCISAQVEKIDADRPDQTESAITVPKNYFQAEFGFSKENISGRNYDLIHPTVLLKYGLKKFDFRLEVTCKSSYEHLIPDPKWTTGIDPVEIGFRAALWEEKKLLPKTSFILSLGIPALASESFKSDHLIPSFRFALQNSITENIGIGYNIGAEWDGFTSTPSWLYTLSPGFNIGEKWYAYIEAFGFIRKNETPQHNIDGGIAYYISRDIKIDVSGGFGITKTAPDNYVSIGFSFRFKMKKGK